MSDNFTHLHVHTEYSLLDGACKVNKLIKKVKELGQTSIAITDHGSMYGVIDFYKAAKKEGIKPIIGCEVYVAPRTRFDKVHKIDNKNFHLVLLCKNQAGYQNLIKLVSAAYIDGFYGKPRIDMDILKEHTEGLIGLSACLAGQIPQALLNGQYSEAKALAQEFKEMFEPDSFYIELQDHGITEQKKIIPQLIQIAREVDLGLVATNDIHYIEKEDSRMQQVLICIQTNKTIYDDDKLEFQTDEFYLKTKEEMANLFPQVPEAITNTQKIVDMCELDFEFGVTKLPNFTAPDGEDNTAFFRRKCYEGLRKHYGENPGEEITKRLEYELGVIERMGYVDYFLIVYDFIHFAKTHDIPVGPGRGSGAGSIAAYCIGITGIDPMKYNLLFERFLNPDRISMPDFDIDFCYNKRGQVIDYVIEKYGYDHVAQIITFGTMAAKAVIRDVARALGIPYQTADTVAKAVPNELGITLEDALKNSDFKALYNSSEELKELIDMSMKIEGMPRHASTHAAGVVITKDPVDSYVPLQKNDEQVVTQFPMTTLEELGLLKMDFLGLRTLTVIDNCQNYIRRTDPEFDIDKVGLDDPAVYKMLSSSATSGVFQFESAGMRSVLHGLKPDSIEDLIAVISLYRPGPMRSIPMFIENRHNPSKVKYKHPLLEPILDVTYGVIIYQEQVMQIVRELAGYTYGQADLVRRAMSKKKMDVMAKEQEHFIKGCAERGVDERAARSIFDEMFSFASYAFNKSHAAAYAFLAYQTAYLKCHYPNAFMAAMLTSILDNTAKVTEYIGECHKLGIEVLPPDINKSYSDFGVENGKIRFSLLALKNVGRNVIKNLVEERTQNGAFTSLYDFCYRMYDKDINKRSLESLIKSGACDCLGANRKQMLRAYEAILNSVDNSKKNTLEGQINLFAMSTGEETAPMGEDKDFLPDVEEFDTVELLKQEKETTGLYLSGHPLKDYVSTAKKLKVDEIASLYKDDSGPEIFDGKHVKLLCVVQSVRMRATQSNSTMAFIVAEDLTGTMRCIIFPKTLKDYTEQIREENILYMEGRITAREDEENSVIIEKITPVEYLDTEKHKVDTSKKNGVYIKVASQQSGEFQKSLEIMKVFGGDFPVYFYFEDQKKYVLAPEHMWVKQNDMFLAEMKKVVGENSVVLKNH